MALSNTGEPLFIGRIRHQGIMIPGKIHPSHGGLFVAYASKEHSYQHGYEILVARA